MSAKAKAKAKAKAAAKAAAKLAEKEKIKKVAKEKIGKFAKALAKSTKGKPKKGETKKKRKREDLDLSELDEEEFPDVEEPAGGKEGPLLKMEVLVCEEGAGAALYGKRGEVLHHIKGKVQIALLGGKGIVQVEDGHVRSTEGLAEPTPQKPLQFDREAKLSLLAEFPADSLQLEALFEEGNDLSNVYMSLYWKILQRDNICEGAYMLDARLSLQICMYFDAKKEKELQELLREVVASWRADGKKLWRAMRARTTRC